MRTVLQGVGPGWGAQDMRTMEAAGRASQELGQDPEPAMQGDRALSEGARQAVSPTRLRDEAALSGLTDSTFLPTPSFWCLSL